MVLLGRCNVEPRFLITPSWVGANSLFFLAGVYTLELQGRRRRMRIWAWSEGCDGSVVLRSLGQVLGTER